MGPSPAERRRRWPRVVGGLVVLFVVIGLVPRTGGDGDDDEQRAEANEPADTTELPESTTTTTEVPEYEPVPDDFALEVVTLEKKCFGTAGCNLTYQIEVVSYLGEPFDPDARWQVIYEVRGGEDGPQINTLTIGGDGEYLVDREERVSTASSDDELTAVATRVRPS